MLKLPLFFACVGIALGSLYGRPKLAEPAPWPVASAACEESAGVRLVYDTDGHEHAATFAPAEYTLHYFGGTADNAVKRVAINNGVMELTRPAAMYIVDFCIGTEFYSDFAAAPHTLVGRPAQELFTHLHAAGYKVHWVHGTTDGRLAVCTEESMAFRWQQNGKNMIAFARRPWFLVDASTGNITKVQAEEWAYVAVPDTAYAALLAVAHYYETRDVTYCSRSNYAPDYVEDLHVSAFPDTCDFQTALPTEKSAE